jgi:hypothetical protein
MVISKAQNAKRMAQSAMWSGAMRFTLAEKPLGRISRSRTASNAHLSTGRPLHTLPCGSIMGIPSFCLSGLRTLAVDTVHRNVTSCMTQGPAGLTDAVAL